jgi:hypothetical protein
LSQPFFQRHHMSKAPSDQPCLLLLRWLRCLRLLLIIVVTIMIIIRVEQCLNLVTPMRRLSNPKQTSTTTRNQERISHENLCKGQRCWCLDVDASSSKLLRLLRWCHSSSSRSRRRGKSQIRIEIVHSRLRRSPWRGGSCSCCW